MQVRSIFLLCVPFSLVVACVDGDDQRIDEQSSVAPIAAPAPPPVPTCTPQPPINPNLCNPYEPVPPPPPIKGKCTIDIRGKAVGFWTGQGWLEGRAEAATFLSATDLDTGAQTTSRYPATGTVKMEVDKEQYVNMDLGTYVVQQGDTKDVKICATFIEDDPIDADDNAFPCRTITLECPQPGVDFTLGADLCKGGDCSKKAGRMTADIEVLTADADGDCVPNEDDYTPEPCDEALKGQECHASMIHYFYGGGVLTDLVQFLGTDLTPAETGYDKVVLMIDDDHLLGWNLNPNAVALADVVMLPTEENFFTSLQELTAEGCRIDVWDFSHGSPDWDDGTPGTSAFVNGGWITTGEDDEHLADPTQTPDIRTHELLEHTDPAVSGTPSVPVQMTYATACNYSEWNSAWLTVGAKVTSGARDVNFKPTTYPYFANAWSANVPYGNSIAGESPPLAETVAFSFIAAEAVLPPWLCVGNSVLGKNNCAFNFFTDVDQSPIFDAAGTLSNDGPDEAKYTIGGPLADLAGVPYDGTVSGAVNMRRSSAKVVAGNPLVRKNSAGLVWP